MMANAFQTTDSTPKYLDHITYQRLKTIQSEYAGLHGYVSAMVCAFGIMANIANITVLNKKHMLSSTNVILMWLAVADLCTMIEYVPFAFKFYIFKETGKIMLGSRSFSWMCYLLFHANFSLTMHSISIWLTIVLAFFRFLYIFFPARGIIFCSVKHARYIILTVYISAIVVCIPNYISNYYNEYWSTVDGVNVSAYEMEYRTYGNFRHVCDFNYWLQAILIKLVPCVLLTILTILLISALHKAHKKHVHLKCQGTRKDDVEKHHEHLRTTAMLLVVVVLFLITELPQGILTLLMIFLEELNQELYSPLGDILDIAALLNNGINFVLYASMSREFRDTFVYTFCRCLTNTNDSRLAKLNIITLRNGNSNTRTQSMAQSNGEML